MAENEYGARLDRNGYAPSILQKAECCFRCGRTNGKLDRNEIFGGVDRNKSKRYGLWVLMCHEPCHSIFHSEAEYRQRLRAYAQGMAQEEYGWSTETFRQMFGKSYR